ncbi:MAG: endo-1,4-beta-xylanase [Ruminococcus sp.]|nr:endo-1,4-beta-xylanase [Ruminococcus sp.]
MIGKNYRKLLAGVMGAAMALSSVASTTNAAFIAGENITLSTVSAASSSGSVIYSTDFEDGDVSYFSNRGGDDTTVISSGTDEKGNKVLVASGRSKDWNGPAFHFDKICKPYTEYYVSFRFKGKYYTGNTVSFQYDDMDGTPHYKNLIQNISTSDWYTVKNLKISFTDEMQNVSVYLEGGQDDIYIDDFTVEEVPVVPIEDDLKSIRKVYADDFKIGTAITPDNLSSKPFMALVEKHFNGSLTAGNEMKPDSVLNKTACQNYFEETGDDENPQLSFSAAKPFLNYCKKNHVPVRVHTLVWHSQTPDWFFKEGYKDDGEWVSKEKMLKRMENYIKNYFTELTKLYPDVDFYACDVVNEAWTNDGKPRNPGEQGQSGSEKSAWVQVFGDNSFIEPAFTFARKYAPKGCKLYYNDYNEYMSKIDTIISMAKELNAKGVLDGIGLQSHLDARDKSTSAFPTVDMYDKALDKYAATGLDIQITELDATVDQNDPSKYIDYQQEYYKGIMDSIVKHKDAISAVVFWGVTDDASWRAKQLPLLFDANYKAKPAYYGVVGDREEKDIPEPVTDPTEPTTGGYPAAKVWGDANDSGDVKMNDAVLIMQSIANSDEYGENGSDSNHITAQGIANADVYENGTSGLTNKDALQIQKYLIHSITSLDPKDFTE